VKTFANVMPKDLNDAIVIAQRARAGNQAVAFAGGGSDLLGMMKDRLVTPDVLVYLKGIKGLDSVTVPSSNSGGNASGASGARDITIGGLTTLDALSRHELIRRQYAVLAEAAETVATPQVRNVATLAGNLCQRPWCWYYRNGFKCFKNGGTTCFSASGENQFHSIFGGGPSYIVHPSDTAPALVALDARFRIVGPSGERIVPAGEFFTLPKDDAARENVLAENEVLASVVVPRATAGMRSRYVKVMDREAWTHALVSAAAVVHLDGDLCRQARIVLGGVAPIPWRLIEVEQLLTGQRLTSALAAAAGRAAVSGARPLAKNGYKVAIAEAVVRRIVESFA
jgi:xanthine dehydrogenase YagS FAD-binding subunit